MGTATLTLSFPHMTMTLYGPVSSHCIESTDTYIVYVWVLRTACSHTQCVLVSSHCIQTHILYGSVSSHCSTQTHTHTLWPCILALYTETKTQYGPVSSQYYIQTHTVCLCFCPLPSFVETQLFPSSQTLAPTIVVALLEPLGKSQSAVCHLKNKIKTIILVNEWKVSDTILGNEKAALILLKWAAVDSRKKGILGLSVK